jgi:uncharacterized protein (DUF952 family)
MEPIFHIVAARAWDAACEVGRYLPDSLAGDGFVHFSFASQVVATANLWYRDRDDLIVVEVDPARLADPVVSEDLYGRGETFPHVYGPIPTSAAVGRHELSRTPDGGYAFLR